jgi:hypothetical protein
MMVACAKEPTSTASTSQTGTAPASQSSEGLVERLTLEQLTTQAAYILVGQVTIVVSHEEGDGKIYTVVTLSVEQVIKGESEPTVAIVVPGGQVNGQQLWVEDSPRFAQGERVLLFLENTGVNLSVVGGVQGKFTIDESNVVNGNLTLTEFINQLKNILTK